jgi:phage baseplate assembly protein W
MTAPMSLGLPFAVDPGGRVVVARDATHLRERILQVLFTAPGERVNQPDFGCGLLDMVFEADDPVLTAAVEFTVGQALVRWLGREILLDGVDVAAEGEQVTVEVAWRRRDDLAAQALRVLFGSGGSGG